MKRIILISLLMVLMIPGLALAVDNLPPGWGPEDFPPIPPSEGDGYIMQFYHDSVYGNPHWVLSCFPSETTILKYDANRDLIIIYGTEGYIEKFKAELVYDRELEEWIVKPFRLVGRNSFSYSNRFSTGAQFVEYWNVNIYTASTGELWREPNPFPAPPLVVSELAGVELAQLANMIGLETQIILQIGLMVLLVCLVIYLVRWLLRLFI